MGAVAWALALAGCGDDGPPPPPGPGPGDGGTDTGGGGDGARPDAGRDGRTGSDGGVVAGECVYDPSGDRFVVGSDLLGRELRLALAPVGDGRAVVLWAGVGTDGIPGVSAVTLGPGGSPGPVVQVDVGGGSTRSPAAAPVGSAAVAVWVDSTSSAFELWSAVLNGDGPPLHINQLTINEQLESAPVLSPLGGGALLAWLQGDPLGDTQELRLRRLGADGTPSGAEQTVPLGTTQPTAPALAAGGSRSLLGWVDGRGGADGRHAWLQVLDGSDAPEGMPVQLDQEGESAGTVALGWSGSGGIAVYDVDLGGGRIEVRYRLLDDTGRPRPGYVGVASPDTGSGIGPAVAAFQGGWAIASRVLEAGDVERTRVEVALVDGIGEVVERIDLGATTFEGGPVSVSVGSRGDLFVAFFEVDESGAHDAVLARVRCSGGGSGTPDGGAGDAGPGEAGVIDGDVPDAVGTPPDASGCYDDAGAPDPCACPAPVSCSGGSGCPADAICVRDGCGGERCVPRGRACASPGDCPSGSTCTPVGDTGASVCVPDGTGCNDSRDCPLGFACESGSCVDRRIACTPGGDDCPWGFYCYLEDARGAAFCLPINAPCATDEACLGDARCRDLRGDGRRVCSFDGTCASHADCTGSSGGDKCVSAPVIYASCGPNGVCASDADCAAGFECLDLWGDGVRTCVGTGGSCARSADCPAGQVCAPTEFDGPPSCVGTPLAG